MKLVILTAVLAVCGAARPNRSYVPSLSLRTAPALEGSSRDGVPTGGYTNDALGVVVDAAAPGTRTSGAEPTGLGGPRTSYGSTDSKVGDAAFRASLTGIGGPSGATTRIAPGFETITGEKGNVEGSTTRIAPGFESVLAYGSDNDKAHANTLKFSNEIGLDKYSYGFETDNGIAIGEKGVSKDGVNANGGYSYKGNDGKVYSISYTADKNGYKPQGSHLPTPPPTPKEILVSLEKNAEEEAAGVVDDGSYDAQKYNDEGDTSNNAGNIGTSFVSHSNQANSPVSPIGLPTGNSAYSSAITTGSGSANAYAGTGPSHTDLKNQYTLTYGLTPHGASGSSVSVPSSATASASVSGKGSHFGANYFPTRFGQSQNSFGQVSGANVQSQTQSSTQPSFSPSSQQISQAGSVSQLHTGQYKPQSSQSSFSQTGSNNANFANSGQYYHNRQPNVPVGTVLKPGYSSAPVVTTVSPIASTQSGQYQGTSASSQYNGLTQAAVSPLTVASSTPSTQYQSQSSNFGQSSSQAQLGSSGSQQAVIQVGQTPIVQTQSGSQTDNTNTQSQQGTIYEYNKPVTVSQQQQTVTHFGSKPIVQTQSGYTQTQPQQGTIYQYNKPTSVNQQTVSQFGSKPIVHGQTVNSQTDNSQTLSQQGTIYQYNKPTSVNQQTVTQSGTKPIQSQSSYSQSQTQPQQGTVYEYNKPTSYKETTSTAEQVTSGQAPFLSHGTQLGNQASNTFGSTSGQPSTLQQTQNQGTVFGSQPVEQSGQKGSVSTSFTQTPFAGSQTGSTLQQSQLGTQGSQSGQNSGTQQNQGTIYEYNKPVNALTHTDSNSFSSGSQLVQGSNSQSGVVQVQNTQSSVKPIGISQTSSTFKPSEYDSQQASLFAQKVTETGYGKQPSGATPISVPTRFGEQVVGSSQTGSNFQQTQLGSSFGQKPSTQTQTSFGQQPTSTSQTGYGFQQTAFGASGSKFGQKPQTVFTSGTSSKGQSTQFGQQSFGSPSTSQIVYPAGSKFGQNTQTAQNTGLNTAVFSQTTTSKPVVSQTGSYFQQIGQTPQTNQGSSFTIAPSKGQPTQTSQFGQAQNVGSGFTQSQYGSSAGIKPQSGFGTVSTTTPQVQPISHYAIKPVGSQSSQNTFQQTQFGSTTGSQFGQKVPSSAGTVFTTSQLQPISQFTKKPFGSQSTQNTYQQTQFGVRPFGSTQNYFSRYPQIQYGSLYASQNRKNTQLGFGTGTPQVPFSQYGQKPFGSQYTPSLFTQTQYGSSIGSRFGENQPTTVTVPVTTTSFVQKPLGVSQTATSNEQTQFGSGSVTPIKGQSVQTTQIGVKPVGSSQTSGSSFSQSQNTQSGFGTGTPQVVPISQYGQKPSGSQYTPSSLTQTQYGSSIGSLLGENQPTTVSVPVTTTSFVQKPVGVSQTSTGNEQTQFVSSSVTPIKGQSVQTTQIGVKPVGSSQTSGSTFSQSQNTQSGFGTGTPQVVPISQDGQKPSVSQYTPSSSTQTQYGSSIGSLLGENQPTTVSVPVTTTSFVQKPVGVSQTSTGNEQTQFGSSSVTPIKGQSVQTNQIGVKPVGSSQTSGSILLQNPNTQSGFGTGTPQVAPLSQYGQKPSGSQYTPSSFTQTQYGSAIGSRFGENQPTTVSVPVTTTSFVQKPVGVLQTFTGNEQTQFVSSSVTPIKGQSVQTTQIGVKPVGSSQTSGSTFSQSQNTQSGFGTGTPQVVPISQYGQKPSGSQYTPSSLTHTQHGSSIGSLLGQNQPTTVSVPVTTTSFVQKPVGVSQTSTGNEQTQFGSSSVTPIKGQSVQTNQIGVKPVGSSQTSGSILLQNPNTQSGFGTGTPQVVPISQYGQKPSGSQYTPSSFTQTQYGSAIGSRFGENQPTTVSVPVTTTSFVQKPVSVSQASTGYEQTKFGSSSVTPIKGQSVQTTQIGAKPVGSSQTSGSTFSQSQFGAFGVQKGQNSQSGVNAFSTTTQAPQYQATQFGSSLGSQANKGSSFSIGTGSKGQTTQYGVKPFGFGYYQTQHGSSFGSQNSQNAQSGVGTVSTITPQVQQISQYGPKPFGSQSTQNVFPQAQYVSSQFGQNQQTVGSVPTTTTTLVQQPVGVSQVGSGNQQSQFGSSSSVASTGVEANQGQGVQTAAKPSQNSGSSFTQSQFGALGTQNVQNQESGVSPFSTTQSPQYQGSQFGSSTGSQSGQTQFNQKPFGSIQNTGSNYQQTQSGSQFGSNFNVKPQAAFGTQSSSSVFGQGSQSQFGSLVKKPYSSPFYTQFGVFGQKPQASASAFASSSPSFGGTQAGQVSKYQTTQFGTSGTQAANTFGGSQAVQGQTTQTSSQFGAQPLKPFGSSQATYQQSQLTGIKKPVGSQSTFQYGQSTPSTVNSFSIIPSKEQNAFSTVSRFGEQSKFENQHTYQSTLAPLEYSTTYASTEGYGSSTPTSFVSTSPQTYYYSTPSPLRVVGSTGSTSPSSFVSTSNFGSNQITSKPGLTVSTVQTPISGVVINNQQAGFVEKFAGFRKPTSYNHVTGYNY